MQVEEGGAVAAIESGSVASMISDAAFRYQRELETGERQIVGVNLHAETDEVAARGFVVPSELQTEQVANLAETKRQRSGRAVQKSLDAVRSAAEEGRNTVPALIEAARVLATLGEIVESLAEVYGHYPSARSTAGQIL